MEHVKEDTSTRSRILGQAIEYTSKDRNTSYGAPEDNFGNIADIWNAQGVRIDDRECTATDVALMMIGMKLARLRFNPKHEDSWIDIAGYAACGAECALKVYDGKIFVAPLGTDAGTWPEGWQFLGYTDETQPFTTTDEKAPGCCGTAFVTMGRSHNDECNLRKVKEVDAKLNGTTYRPIKDNPQG